MAQFVNPENRFGGPSLIADLNHMSDIKPLEVNQRNARQAEQSDSNARQQGTRDQNASAQQGGERKRKSR